jgi:two-component SAPR family response regulator
MIARRHLRPPDPDTVDWPWPLRVSCLGRFEVFRHDKPIAVQGRGHKTLELLQFIVAHGGSKVPVDRVVKALWPGEGRQGAQQAFDTTVHRLRKLLGSDDAIVVGERQVTINRQETWVDALALESRLSTLGTPGGTLNLEALREVVRLYAGHFLPHRQDAAWARDAHERLWGRTRRQLIESARALRASGDNAQAERVLSFVVDRDPLAEDAFAELMRLHLDHGHATEAVRAYDRCAAALAAEMGMEPGEELRRLWARARAGGAGDAAGRAE